MVLVWLLITEKASDVHVAFYGVGFLKIKNQLTKVHKVGKIYLVNKPLQNFLHIIMRLAGEQGERIVK